MESKDKYKMFRNFMFNELGISKADIEQWTKDALQEKAAKLAGQINIRGVIQAKLDNMAYQLKNELVVETAKKLAERITIGFK